MLQETAIDEVRKIRIDICALIPQFFITVFLFTTFAGPEVMLGKYYTELSFYSPSSCSLDSRDKKRSLRTLVLRQWYIQTSKTAKNGITITVERNGTYVDPYAIHALLRKEKQIFGKISY